ncbi:AAA family ATPase [Shewanella japonica]|uniref:AAA family ATPase n=1 Tax=Shewanella japonica TaxID=93973 RepID=UPI0024949EB8|nr:AAA family ATPase [Shewanella japonica]
MDIQQTLLLPSQESLVQRLQHIASYSEQLVLLSGAKGAGKTTLVTALASELDSYNSALVICPMHADSAEIRRKILVQLISSPIFDDALPLADTLLRIQSSLTKPLHIIIDDAQYMPKELWAECLILTQLQCAGKPISMTFTIETDSLAELTHELTDSMQALLLHVELEPLSLAEREGLYRTLLVRSNKTPFIPREIIQAQIEKQSGTPTEVINLLNKALEDQPEDVKKWPKFLPWVMGSVVLLLTLVIASWFMLKETAEVPADNVQFNNIYSPPETPAQWAIYNYAELLLQPVINDTAGLNQAEAGLRLDALKPTLTEFNFVDIMLRNSAGNNSKVTDEYNVNSNISQTEDEQNVEISEDELAADSKTYQSPEARSQDINQDVQLSEVSEGKPIVESDKLVAEGLSNNDNTASLSLLDKPGYTLQIASVREAKSLTQILSKLERIQTDSAYAQQARYKQRHIVLFGQYDTVSQAQQQADELQQSLGLSAPWVRKWSDLTGYELKID